MRYILLFSLALFISSCSGDSAAPKDKPTDGAIVENEKNYVDTVVLRKSQFLNEIISNGKLRASGKSNLKFLSQGTISKIFVKNGDRVKRGDIIAELDKQVASLRYSNAVNSMEKAKIDLKDYVLGLGMGADTSKLPKEMLKVAKIKSGYSQAMNNYQEAKFDFDNVTLRAPFDGLIANVSQKEHDVASGDFCTIIDDSWFDVEFTILEPELQFVKRGGEIVVKSYSGDKEYKGVISSINPVVDDKGQMKVAARVTNNGGDLIEGMNVKISIYSSVPGRFVVPKRAVVIRDKFTVLFRYDKESGKAMWTYVNIEMSNSKYHSVVANADKNASLNEGDVVIVSGNLNLANESDVMINRSR